MAGLEIVRVTDSLIECRATDLDPTIYTDIEWFICDLGTLSPYQSQGIFILTTMYYDFTFNNLQSNRKYQVAYRLYYYDGTYTDSIYSQSILTESSSSGTTRPAKFSWTTGTYNQYADVMEKVSGHTFDLTAAEWNGLCNNVKAVGAYANGATYNFSTAYPGYTFYYDMYNEVARAIEEIVPYNITLPTVEPGQPVNAADLNILMNAINLVQ